MANDPEMNGPDETIDADFEPAPAADYVVPNKKNKRSGPGWIPLGLVGALSLGALGISASGFIGNSAGVPANYTEEIDALLADQQQVQESVADLRKSTEASEKRMAAQVEALLTGDEDGEGLATLVAELESVSRRLDEASLGGENSDDLKALTDRLAALEEIDEDDDVSPRELRRAVTAMQARVDSLESQNKGLTQQIASRTETLASLTARVEDMEFAVQDSGSVPASAQSSLLDDLQKEMENLRTTVERTEDIEVENEKRFSDMLKGMQTVGQAEVEVDRAETTASAALAVSRIEAAARDGRSFHSAYKKLADAMPNDPAVKSLAPIARSGAPTLRELSTQFSGDRDAALGLVEQSAEDGWDWTRQVFGSGVKVRKAGETGGPRELLDQAESALDKGDLKQAIGAIEKLPDNAKDVMGDWLSGASNRIALEDALDDIGVKLIGQDR